MKTMPTNSPVATSRPKVTLEFADRPDPIQAEASTVQEVLGQLDLPTDVEVQIMRIGDQMVALRPTDRLVNGDRLMAMPVIRGA